MDSAGEGQTPFRIGSEKNSSTPPPTNSNPYAPAAWEGEDGQSLLVAPPFQSRAPWSGGWGLMTLAVACSVVAFMATASVLEFPLLTILVLPCSLLIALAVLVRFLHHTVIVQWFLYLLTVAGFGLATYLCFVPVCMAVTIPTMSLESLIPGSRGFYLGEISMFLSLTLTGLLFVALLRVYFNASYKRQRMDEMHRDLLSGQDHPMNASGVKGHASSMRSEG